MSVLFQAFFATIADLGLGFAFACILALIVVLIRSEAHAAREAQQEPTSTEYVDPWASFPAKWNPPEASTESGQQGREAA